MRAIITTSCMCAAVLAAMVAGCGGMEERTPERGPLNLPEDIAKADSAYSCQGHCGDQAPGGCWCDALCASFGDCCPDKKKECDAQPAKCTGNADCAAKEYCHFADGACLLPTMNILEGVCKPRPEMCYELYAPVCGCDGQTYGNDCFAHAAGASVGEQGECKTKKCGPFPGGACAPGEVCNIDSCGLGASGTCLVAPKCNTYFHEPVCGCDGQTYGNDCLRMVAGAAKNHDGECKQPCWGAWLDEKGACRTPADGIYPDHCCDDERPQACTKINQDYVDAIQNARTCNPFIYTPQCQYSVPDALTCGCSTFVNSKAPLAPHTARWTQFRCDTVAFACPAVLCAEVTSAYCAVNSRTCQNQ